jgi:hypothetical protein
MAPPMMSADLIYRSTDPATCWQPRMLTIGDFRLAFFLIALLPLVSSPGFLRLSLVALARLEQPDRISPSRMAEMLEGDEAGPRMRC